MLLLLVENLEETVTEIKNFTLRITDKLLVDIIPIMEYNILIMEVSNMEYLTATEVSKKWNISSRRISVLCTEGRVDGAVKKGKMWLIPEDTKKPADARYKKHINVE